jgi:hypothetical protein
MVVRGLRRIQICNDLGRFCAREVSRDQRIITSQISLGTVSSACACCSLISAKSFGGRGSSRLVLKTIPSSVRKVVSALQATGPRRIRPDVQLARRLRALAANLTHLKSSACDTQATDLEISST